MLSLILTNFNFIVSHTGYIDLYKEIKGFFDPLRELFKIYFENPDSFNDLNNNELEDQTGNFIQKLIEEAQELLDECKIQSEQIEEVYKNFMKFVGDDPKKISIEDFLSIINKFRIELEVCYKL